MDRRPNPPFLCINDEFADLCDRVVAALDQQPQTYQELAPRLGEPLLLKSAVMFLRRRERIFYCRDTKVWSTKRTIRPACRFAVWLRQKGQQLKRVLTCP